MFFIELCMNKRQRRELTLLFSLGPRYKVKILLDIINTMVSKYLILVIWLVHIFGKCYNSSLVMKKRILNSIMVSRNVNKSM
jgi:hypothetical protein